MKNILSFSLPKKRNKVEVVFSNFEFKLKNETKVNLFLMSFRNMVLTHTESEVLQFLFEYFNDLIINNNINDWTESYEITNKILEKLDLETIKPSILLGFLTITFHYRTDLPYYKVFLYKVIDKLVIDGEKEVAERTLKRFDR